MIDSYSEIVRNYIERRWEPSEPRGGKLAEVAYSIVEGAVSGKFPSRAKKPKNMADACRALENRPANAALVGDKSLRVFIPRALIFLHDVRNQRGVGHVGGDVDPNSMDATAVLSLAGWVMAELVRIFHDTTTEVAQQTVDALVERKTPLIWEVEAGGMKRILVPKMEGKDQVLLFLHHSTGWVPVSHLLNWTGQKNSTRFRDKLLTELHGSRLI